ncbi:MAG: NADH:ubiquinone oxidoreductase [Piccolia ochrophora]|nr:MAG: NADH:ubiquinone oxidoreductase [Piccolia ochrophora]
MDESVSSQPNGAASAEESLAYYKSQYEQLELELADFQASSRELETELEKDVEASERRERLLKEKVESLGYEVEEWKTKYKQSKSEANTAQNTLQKEITTLRDTTRNLQMRLRDIEVANDDFERQARNTSSSLEDLESKYSVAIERAVLLEAEIQIGEQEREDLRIDAQRLRDELSDLKIEAEITQGKLLRHAEAATRHGHGTLEAAPSITSDRPRSPVSAATPTTASPSPTTSTPRKSTSTVASEALTPPSPPVSDTSAAAASLEAKSDDTPRATTSSTTDANTTPRPLQPKPRPSGHLRGPSLASRNSKMTPTVASRTLAAKSQGSRNSTLPSSSSLRQIRGLIGQMQKLEERVHSARSKLPAPVNTPPRASPRSGSALGHHIPASVTIRSPKKRTGGSNISGRPSYLENNAGDTTPLSTQHISRLSMGGGGGGGGGGPSTPAFDRSSRPSSRASISSHNSSAAYPAPQQQRPHSRASLSSGVRTPLGHYSSAAAESRRPRSSISGNYAATHGHGHGHVSAVAEERDSVGFSTPTALSRRRSTLNRDDILAHGGTAIPTPSGLPRRQSGGEGALALNSPAKTPAAAKVGRRVSSGTAARGLAGAGAGNAGAGNGEMGPPGTARRRLSGVGESF